MGVELNEKIGPKNLWPAVVHTLDMLHSDTRHEYPKQATHIHGIPHQQLRQSFRVLPVATAYDSFEAIDVGDPTNELKQKENT